MLGFSQPSAYHPSWLPLEGYRDDAVGNCTRGLHQSGAWGHDQDHRLTTIELDGQEQSLRLLRSADRQKGSWNHHLYLSADEGLIAELDAAVWQPNLARAIKMLSWRYVHQLNLWCCFRQNISPRSSD